MKLLKSKKADLKFVLRAALVVFLLVILTSITLNAVNRWRDSTEDCIGTCRTSCNIGEVRYSSTCIRDGDEVSGLVCCTGGMTDEEDEEIPEEYVDEINEESENETSEEDTEEETVEIDNQNVPEDINIVFTKGENFEVLSPETIRIGQTYNYAVKTTGPENINSCEIIFIDYETKNRIDSIDTFEHVNVDGHCDESFTITLKEEDLQTFPDYTFIIQIKLINENETTKAYSNYVFNIKMEERKK